MSAIGMNNVLYVSMILVRSLVAELERRGIEASQLFAQPDIGHVLINDSRAVISVAMWHRFIARAAEITGDDALGLSMGQHLPEHALQVISHLALSSHTLREAILMLQRFSALVGNIAEFELLEEGDLAYFVHRVLVPFLPLPQFSSELALSLAYRIALRFLIRPGQRPREVWFAHPAPSYADRYGSAFDCAVRFDRPRNAIVVERGLLDHAQPLADSPMLLVLQAHAERMLLERGQPSLPDKVRALLRYDQDLCHVNPKVIAKTIGVHPRALRRELSEANCSLRVLIEEALRQLAHEDLLSPGVSIKEISNRLGFSEPSAFHRAFKRWTGNTPAEYRRELRKRRPAEPPAPSANK